MQIYIYIFTRTYGDKTKSSREFRNRVTTSSAYCRIYTAHWRAISSFTGSFSRCLSAGCLTIYIYIQYNIDLNIVLLSYIDVRSLIVNVDSWDGCTTRQNGRVVAVYNGANEMSARKRNDTVRKRTRGR